MDNAIEQLANLYQKHRISIKINGERKQDLTPVLLGTDTKDYLLYVEDEYLDFNVEKPLICLFLILRTLEDYDDCEDFLAWCRLYNLDSSDPEWQHYYRGLSEIYSALETSWGSVDSYISSLDYQLRSGVFYSLLNFKLNH